MAVFHRVACQIKLGAETRLKEVRRQETILRIYPAGTAPGVSTGSSLRMENAKEVRMCPEIVAVVVVAAAAVAELRP